jgi:hypothetical protein
MNNTLSRPTTLLAMLLQYYSSRLKLDTIAVDPKEVRQAPKM